METVSCNQPQVKLVCVTCATDLPAKITPSSEGRVVRISPSIHRSALFAHAAYACEEQQGHSRSPFRAAALIRVSVGADTDFLDPTASMRCLCRSFNGDPHREQYHREWYSRAFGDYDLRLLWCGLRLQG